MSFANADGCAVVPAHAGHYVLVYSCHIKNIQARARADKTLGGYARYLIVAWQWNAHSKRLIAQPVTTEGIEEPNGKQNIVIRAMEFPDGHVQDDLGDRYNNLEEWFVACEEYARSEYGYD
jgi:hypothetical protein